MAAKSFVEIKDTQGCAWVVGGSMYVAKAQSLITFNLKQFRKQQNRTWIDVEIPCVDLTT